MSMYTVDTLFRLSSPPLSSDAVKALLIPNDPCGVPNADGYTFSLNVSVVDETTRGEYSVEFTNRADSITRGPVLVTPNGMLCNNISCIMYSIHKYMYMCMCMCLLSRFLSYRPCWSKQEASIYAYREAVQ